MVYFMHPFYNTIIMKKALFVYFALITYCFLSCSEKSVNKVTSLVEYDSISVSIDYPILPAYSKLSSFVGDKADAVGQVLMTQFIVSFLVISIISVSVIKWISW